MKISCVIPTHNRPKLLIGAIKSVLNQTYRPFEIIVVNNGNEKINLPKEITHEVIIYDIASNSGVSKARNYGAKKSSGDYLAFLDDDDIWNNKYLENVTDAIKKGAVCVASRVDQIIEGKISALKNPHNKLSIHNLLIYNPGFGGSNIVISKNLFNDVGGFDINLITSEDKSLALEILKKGVEIKTLPDNQIIASMDNYNRLTDNNRIAKGTYGFTKKYKDSMNKKEYLLNWKKIYKYRYDSGNKLAAIPYLFLYLFFRSWRVFSCLIDVMNIKSLFSRYYQPKKSFFNENIIYFRDDDVVDVTPNLKKILNIFIDNGVPLDLSVIPGKVTFQATQLLLKLKTEHPELIHFHQHGFLHKKYGDKSNYEFGANRSFAEQFSDIKKGREIMKKYFGNYDNIFTPPYHGYNLDTLKALNELNFECLSANVDYSEEDGKLKMLPAQVDIMNYGSKPYSLKKERVINNEINNALSRFRIVGIVLHHDAFKDSDFENIDKIIVNLIEREKIRFLNMKKIYRNVIL